MFSDSGLKSQQWDWIVLFAVLYVNTHSQHTQFLYTAASTRYARTCTCTHAIQAPPMHEIFLP